jgi:hypothetical protein
MRERISAAALLLIPAGSLSAADPRLLGMVMPEASVVAGVNVAQARGTPFGQYVLGQARQESADFAKFVAITGFDPRRDLTEVVFASAGESGKKAGLAIARGTFDVNRLVAAARADGHSVDTYQGVEVATSRNGNDSVAFLDATLALAGSASEVRAAIERRNRPTAFHAAIAARIAQLGSTQDAWFVSLGPLTGLNPTFADRNLNGALRGDVAKSIEQASAGVKFGALAEIHAEAVARSEKDATALADVVRFLAGMIQLNMPEKEAEAFGPLLQSLDVTAQATTVRLSLSIPEDQVERLFAPRRGGRTPGRPSRR